MLKALASKLFPKSEPEFDLELANITLLYLLAQADNDFCVKEAAIIETLVADSDQVEKLKRLEKAKNQAQQATSLYDYTKQLNEQLSYKARVDIVEDLWRVAYADGVLDKYEEQFVRQLCDLMYIAHSDYIQTRNRIRDSAKP